MSTPFFVFITEEATELHAVKRSLSLLFGMDKKNALDALFTQIRDGDEITRSKNLEFLKTELNTRQNEVNASEELQRHIADWIKMIMQAGASGSDIKLLLDLLQTLPLFRSTAATNTLPAELVNLITLAADLSKDFDPANQAHITQLVDCMNTVVPLVKRGGDGTPFVSYVLIKAGPQLAACSEPNAFALLKGAAQLIKSVPVLSVRSLVAPLYAVLRQQLPRAEEAEGQELKPTVTEAVTAAVEGEKKETGTKLFFSNLECILFMFHILAAKNQALFSHIVAAPVVTAGQPIDTRGQESKQDFKEDFAARLKLLEEQAKTFSTKLNETAKNLRAQAQAAQPAEAKKQANDKIATLAQPIRLLKSLQNLASALLKKQPTFFAKPQASWFEKQQGQQGEQKQQGQQQGQQQQQKGQKRKSTGGSEATEKKSRSEQKFSGQPGESVATEGRGQGQRKQRGGKQGGQQGQKSQKGQQAQVQQRQQQQRSQKGQGQAQQQKSQKGGQKRQGQQQQQQQQQQRSNKGANKQGGAGRGRGRGRSNKGRQ